MLKKLLLLCAVSISLISCKKDEDTSPDVSISAGETTTDTRDLKPVLELRFDGNLLDSSSENNTLEAVGVSYVKDRHGDSNRAVYLNDNSRSKLSVKNSDALDFGTGVNKEFTLSFWYKHKDINPSAVTYSLLTKATKSWGGSGDFDYGVSYNKTDGLIPFTGSSSDPVNYPRKIVKSLADTLWHHVVMTCNQTDITIGTKFVYWDGIQVFTGEYKNKGITRDYDLVFGRGKSTTTRFDGYYDDVLIYKKVLNATEVKNLYD